MTSLLSISLVVVATIFGAFGSLFIKLGSAKFNIKIVDQIKNWNLIVGLFLYGLSMILYLGGLRGGDLSVIYPISALQYIWVVVISAKILKEKMNTLKIIGISIIMAGVIIVTMF